MSPAGAGRGRTRRSDAAYTNLLKVVHEALAANFAPSDRPLCRRAGMRRTGRSAWDGPRSGAGVLRRRDGTPVRRFQRRKRRRSRRSRVGGRSSRPLAASPYTSRRSAGPPRSGSLRRATPSSGPKLSRPRTSRTSSTGRRAPGTWRSWTSSGTSTTARTPGTASSAKITRTSSPTRRSPASSFGPGRMRMRC